MDSYSAFPLSGGGTDDRSPWESRGRFEIERELNALRTTNKTLGESMTRILDFLRSKEPLEEDKRQRALESLGYVRDVLQSGSAVPLREDKLFGERHVPKEITDASPQIFIQHRLPRSPPRYPSSPSVNTPSSASEGHQLGIYDSTKSAKDHRPMSPPTTTEGKGQPLIPAPSSTPQASITRPNTKKHVMTDPLGVLH